MGHHKSNKKVEGDPLTDHSGGLPLRPDEEQLEARTELDRIATGLPPDLDATPADADPQAAYTEAVDEVDDQVRDGELRTDDGSGHAAQDPFPPTRYASGD
ncbi:hypothetical protein ABH920_007966 [Catenulispora sp. EB89]|uniref:hypothetical protein n=1 Tax=Catenulispora sp. EB89 TaxID=3156257 RepID=UPI00351521F9